MCQKESVISHLVHSNRDMTTFIMKIRKDVVPEASVLPVASLLTLSFTYYVRYNEIQLE